MSSLRARLFAATLAALALTLALTIAISAILTRRQVDRSQASALAARADDLVDQHRLHPSYAQEDKTTKNIRIVIRPRKLLAAYVPDVDRPSNGETRVKGKLELYSYRPLPHLGLLVMRPASLRASAWRPFLGDLLLAALAGVALAAIVSFFMARSVVRPIRRIADATRALAADESHDPLPREGTRELAALADAFNQMTHELATAREAERDFLLSVSHELKTPLTAIRGYAEGLADGAFDADEAARIIEIEGRRLERLVRDLLDLARMNRSEFSVRTEPVELGEVAHEAVRRHEAAAREFDVSLSASSEETWVEADHDRVLQIASNLVENALRVTPAGGMVTVAAGNGKLVVSDNGPGIPPGDVAHAFERFYLYDRTSRDRQVGSGLGLAIVKQLATAMGGDVSVASGPEGTTFTVELRVQARGVDDLEVGAVQRA